MGIVLSREAGSNTIDYDTFVVQEGVEEFVQTLANVDIYNNLVWDCEEAGLFLQKHPQKDGPHGAINSIRIRFNTIYNCGLTSGNDLNLYGWGDLGITLNGIDLIGNVAFNSSRPISLAQTVIPAGVTIDDNLNFGDGDNTDPEFVDPDTPVVIGSGVLPTIILPDFSLSAGSPAIGTVDAAYSVAPFDTDIIGNSREDDPGAKG